MSHQRPKASYGGLFSTNYALPTDPTHREKLTAQGGKAHGTPGAQVEHRYLVRQISATIQGIKRSGDVEVAGKEDGRNLRRLVRK